MTELQISLDKPRKNLLLTLPEDTADALFGKFAKLAISESVKPAVKEQLTAESEPTQKESIPPAERKDTAERQTYLVACKCGDLKFVRPKYQLKHFLCRKCFTKVPVDIPAMVEARVRCHHCGNGFIALTNGDSSTLEPNCPKCGETIRLAWDGALGVYQTKAE